MNGLGVSIVHSVDPKFGSRWTQVAGLTVFFLYLFILFLWISFYLLSSVISSSTPSSTFGVWPGTCYLHLFWTLEPEQIFGGPILFLVYPSSDWHSLYTVPSS